MTDFLFRGSLADLEAQRAGEQSDFYQALFAASKAFAIADSTIQIANGIAKASNTPWPLNLGAIASTVAATANVLATISSVSMNIPSRQTGGPVSEGLTRVNELGTPELLQTPVGDFITMPSGVNGQMTRLDQPMGKGGAVGNTNLNVVVNDYGSNNEVSTSISEQGDLVVLIQDTIASQAADPDSELNRSFQSNYNVGRTL